MCFGSRNLSANFCTWVLCANDLIVGSLLRSASYWNFFFCAAFVMFALCCFYRAIFALLLVLIHFHALFLVQCLLCTRFKVLLLLLLLHSIEYLSHVCLFISLFEFFHFLLWYMRWVWKYATQIQCACFDRLDCCWFFISLSISCHTKRILHSETHRHQLYKRYYIGTQYHYFYVFVSSPQ